MTAELVVKDANAAEYNLSGGTRSPFVSAYAWGDIYNYAAVGNYHNYLQPATAHYGVSTAGFAPVLSVPNFSGNHVVLGQLNVVHCVAGVIPNTVIPVQNVADPVAAQLGGAGEDDGNQQVQLLEVLDNKNDPAMVNVIPNPLSWSADAWRDDFGLSLMRRDTLVSPSLSVSTLR